MYIKKQGKNTNKSRISNILINYIYKKIINFIYNNKKLKRIIYYDLKNR